VSKKSTIAALDIGTGSIKAIIVERQHKESGFKILGKAESISSGVRKGVVVDPEKAGKVIKATMSEAKKEAGYDIDDVYVNINNAHIFSHFSKGSVSVSRADQEITKEDVERVIEAAQAFTLPQNKEILEVIPREFILDKEGSIKNPVGLHGVRLETEILAIGAFVFHLRNLSQAVLNADLQATDMILGPIAAARAVLTPDEKELGSLVVDLGAGTTGISVFEEGTLLHTAIRPIGTNNIRNDIGIGLQVDVATAEHIRNKFSDSILGPSNAKKEKVRIGTGEEISFKRSEIKKIAEPRLVQIFEEIEKELKKISRDKLLPGGVILTGEGAKTPHLVGLVRKKLGLPCRIGGPRKFFPSEDDIRFSTLCGLILAGMDLEEDYTGGGVNVKGALTKIKNIFKVFLP